MIMKKSLNRVKDILRGLSNQHLLVTLCHGFSTDVKLKRD